MASFSAGTTFTDGVANDVTAAKLGALVNNATPTSGFIQDRTAETVTATNDTLLIGDASDSNNLKRITVADFAQTLPTAKITTGTIDTGTFGTTTSTAATITSLTTGTGTASAPAIAPTGDTNTGLFFPAADTLAATTQGTERLRVDSSGNVGIGTTSPAAGIDVSTGGTATKIAKFRSASYNSAGLEVIVGTNADMGIFTASANPLLLGTDNTERVRITSGGYLKASNAGTYVGAASAFHEIRNDSSGNEALVLSHSAATAPYGMQIRFTASPNDATSTFLSCTDGAGTTLRAELRSNGGLRNYQANDGNLSDERLKKDITASPGYLDKICSIPVVNFKYKDQTHDDYNLGVIAQQVEAVCPELVDADGFGETPEDGIPLKSIYQTDLQYALMKCIQELKAENDSLKSRVAALEAA